MLSCVCSQSMSKCGKNISDTLGYCPVCLQLSADIERLLGNDYYCDISSGNRSIIAVSPGLNLIKSKLTNQTNPSEC